MTKHTCAVVLLWINVTGIANAGFLNNTITADWLYPNDSSILEAHDVEVGPGVEIPSDAIENDTKFDIDIGDNFILFSFNSTSNWTVVSANGWAFSDTNSTIPKIAGYSIGATTGTVTGLPEVDLSFTSESVFANFAGVRANTGSTIRMEVVFVPEPSCLSLMVLGVVTGCLRRKPQTGSCAFSMACSLPPASRLN